MTDSLRLPSVTDVTVALGCGVVTIGAFLAAPMLLGSADAPVLDAARSWATVAVLGLQAVVLVVVRLASHTSLLSLAVLAMLLGLGAPSGLANLAHAAVVVAVLRTTSLLSNNSLRVLLPLAGLAVAVGQASDLYRSADTPLGAAAASGLLQAVVVVVLPAVGVLAVDARRDARRARSGETAAIEREHDARLETAVARERTAMARELHDIAAHHVSGIAVMAAAIERQIDADPSAAKQSVRQVREQSRALLDDLRRLVGLLRDVDQVDQVENIDAIERLLLDARAAGREVTLHVRGVVENVGPLGQLVAFRMVQESLANAALHAPGASCAVTVDGSSLDRVVVTVRNDAAAVVGETGRQGFGVLGMRERAALVGGEIDAGRQSDGSWRVQLTLPAEPHPVPVAAPSSPEVPTPGVVTS